MLQDYLQQLLHDGTLVRSKSCYGTPFTPNTGKVQFVSFESDRQDFLKAGYREQETTIDRQRLWRPLDAEPAFSYCFSTSLGMAHASFDRESLYKVLFIGNQSSGKSSLILRRPHESKDDATLSMTRVKEGDVVLLLYDTATAEGQTSVATASYMDKDHVVLVYDVGNRQSFQQCSYWIEEAASRVEQDSRITVVGNKSDLSERAVTEEEGRAWAALYGFSFFETSTQTKDGLKALYDSLFSEGAKLARINFATMSNVRSTRHGPSPVLKLKHKKKECTLL